MRQGNGLGGCWVLFFIAVVIICLVGGVILPATEHHQHVELVYWGQTSAVNAFSPLVVKTLAPLKRLVVDKVVYVGTFDEATGYISGFPKAQMSCNSPDYDFGPTDPEEFRLLQCDRGLIIIIK